MTRNSTATEYMPAAGLGKWRQDPISQIPIALGSGWGELVTPFVLMSANQFPVPPPPALNTREYAAAFNEVKNYGGCGDDPVACDSEFGGSVTPTERTPEQTQIGIYWGYDGTPGLALRRGFTTKSRCSSPSTTARMPSRWRASWL